VVQGKPQGEASQEQGVKQNSNRYQKEKELAAREKEGYRTKPSSTNLISPETPGKGESPRPKIKYLFLLMHKPFWKIKGGIQKNITPNYTSTRFSPRSIERGKNSQSCIEVLCKIITEYKSHK
jgi:hypothetical protein